jgi:hypothetical protein
LFCTRAGWRAEEEQNGNSKAKERHG